ncbi:MAG: YraN family protein [Bdellovibrio sp.]|nr:YraN family protein [Bdellovibrio sp.]
MAEIHEKGKATEDEALVWFLKNRPSILLCRNFRTRGGEIDLIFEEINLFKGETQSRSELVFVEVRFRPKGAMVSALESVGWLKQRRMAKTAEYFLVQYKGKATTLRYDLLLWDGESWDHRPNLQLVL